MKKATPIFLILNFAFLICKAQHPYFASLNQQLLTTNPSFAGSNKQLRIQTAAGVNDIKTNFYSYAYYTGIDFLLGKHAGFGFSFHQQQLGNALNRLQVDITYAHHFTLGSIKIVPSFQMSYFQKTLDRSKLSYGDMIDPVNGFVYNSNELIPAGSTYNFDYSTGLLVYNENFYAGASILSFTQPDEGLMGVSGRPLTQIYQGGYNLVTDYVHRFRFYILTKIQLPNNYFIQYGSYLTYKQVSLHVAQRINDAVILGFNFTKNGFKTGYNASYHYLPYYPGLFSHEIYLSYAFGNYDADLTSKTLLKKDCVKLLDY